MSIPNMNAAFGLTPNLYHPVRMARARGGETIPEHIRVRLEAFFDADLSTVRVHVGREAGAIGAIAFTHGENLYFAPGRYDPYTKEGVRLLVHELAHVIQQREGRVHNPHGHGVALVEDENLEQEADRLAAEAVRILYPEPSESRRLIPSDPDPEPEPELESDQPVAVDPGLLPEVEDCLTSP